MVVFDDRVFFPFVIYLTKAFSGFAYSKIDLSAFKIREF